MKALRYLLIIMGIMSVLGVSAQALAQKPEAQMQSTSIMAGSGSTLPQAAATGVSLSSGQNQEAPTPPKNIRKGRPGDWTDPYKDPLGDVLWPLMLLAGVYLIVRVARKRSRALKWSRSDVK